MTYYLFMGSMILIGLGCTAWFFRKGGIYNPSTSEMEYIPTPPITTITETMPTLTQLCDAITIMEGANPANNNPGNCKFYEGGYAAMYGVVRRSKGGFAMFATPELGIRYLRNMIKGIIKKYPNLTLLTFFAGERDAKGKIVGYPGYAPKEDKNDPVHYSKFVAKRLAVDNGFPMKNLVLK